MSESHDFRIVIADDDPDIVRLMTAALVRHGFAPPEVVSTGEAALAAAGRTDLLLLDHQLPDLTGTEVLERLHHHPHRPSVVVITGYGTEQVVAEALRLGAEDYVRKEAGLADLLPRVVERVRRTRALRRALAEAEHDLLLAERREATQELTVALHHEINNPLMTALAESTLLLEDPALPSGQRRGVEGIKASLERIRAIVRRIGALGGASATAYVDGVNMADLAAPQANNPARGTALMWIESPTLARITTSLLGRAGYEPRRCSSRDELAWLAKANTVAAVVVATRPGTTSELLTAFAPRAERTHQVIVLTHDDVATATQAGADLVFPIPFDPVTFVRTLSRDHSSS